MVGPFSIFKKIGIFAYCNYQCFLQNVTIPQNSNFTDSFSFQHDQDIQPDLYVLRQGEIQKQKPH